MSEVLAVITGLYHHALLSVSGQNQLLEGNSTSPLRLGGTHHIMFWSGRIDGHRSPAARGVGLQGTGTGHVLFEATVVIGAETSSQRSVPSSELKSLR